MARSSATRRAALAHILLALVAIATNVQILEAKQLICEEHEPGIVMCAGMEYKSEARDIPGSYDFYFHLILCTFFVLFAGMIRRPMLCCVLYIPHFFGVGEL